MATTRTSKVLLVLAFALACSPGPAAVPIAGLPDSCAVTDPGNADGPVTVDIGEFAHRDGTVDHALAATVTVTNTSDAPVRIHGAGGDVLLAFLVQDGHLVSAFPELMTAMESHDDLDPGESHDWRATLRLRRCDRPDAPLLEGTYDAHVRVEWSGSGVPQDHLLSVESVPVEVG